MAALAAKGFWSNKPYKEWKKGEVGRLLKMSPWAKETTVTRKGQGRQGEEFFDYFTIRFFSALPIREALVRRVQIDQKYDKMDPAAREDFDARFTPLLSMDTSKNIILSLEFRSNDRQLIMGIERALRDTNLASLKRSTYLISERLGKVELEGYRPPSAAQPDARLIYPRNVHGQPVGSPEDKKVTVDIWIPGTGTRMQFNKKVEEMMYNGKLEI